MATLHAAIRTGRPGARTTRIATGLRIVFDTEASEWTVPAIVCSSPGSLMGPSGGPAAGRALMPPSDTTQPLVSTSAFTTGMQKDGARLRSKRSSVVVGKYAKESQAFCTWVTTSTFQSCVVMPGRLPQEQCCCNRTGCFILHRDSSPPMTYRAEGSEMMRPKC